MADPPPPTAVSIGSIGAYQPESEKIKSYLKCLELYLASLKSNKCQQYNTQLLMNFYTQSGSSHFAPDKDVCPAGGGTQETLLTQPCGNC